MVASGTPLRSNDVARSVANTALSDPMGMVRDLVRQPTVKKALPIIVILMVVAAFGLASMTEQFREVECQDYLIYSKMVKKKAMQLFDVLSEDYRLYHGEVWMNLDEILHCFERFCNQYAIFIGSKQETQ